MGSSARLKQLLLAFWAMWFTLVVASNVADGLKAAGVFRPTLRFASGNLALLLETTSIYDTPRPIAIGMFVGVVLWEVLAALLFWRATVAWWTHEPALREAGEAFVAGVGLFAGFVLADEIFLAYTKGLEASHFRIFSALLVSWLSIRLLPDK
jgi:hypothetical protein